MVAEQEQQEQEAVEAAEPGSPQGAPAEASRELQLGRGAAAAASPDAPMIEAVEGPEPTAVS